MSNQYSTGRKVQLSTAQVRCLRLVASKVRAYPQNVARQMCTPVYLFDLGLLAQDIRAPVLDYGLPLWITDKGKAMLRRIADGDASVVVR